jgi:N-acylneuraminate cytidylyltransferase
LRAVEKCKQHPGKMWIIKKRLMKPLLENKNEKIPYHSRQYIDLPKIYVQNASLEIAWTKVLNRKKPSIAGNKIIPFISKGKEGFDINNKDDLLLIRELIKKRKFNLPKL